MPIVLATELGDGILGLESNVSTRVHVLLVQPYSVIRTIIPI